MLHVVQFATEWTIIAANSHVDVAGCDRVSWGCWFEWWWRRQSTAIEFVGYAAAAVPARIVRAADRLLADHAADGFQGGQECE